MLNKIYQNVASAQNWHTKYNTCNGCAIRDLATASTILKSETVAPEKHNNRLLWKKDHNVFKWKR